VGKALARVPVGTGGAPGNSRSSSAVSGSLGNQGNGQGQGNAGGSGQGQVGSSRIEIAGGTRDIKTSVLKYCDQLGSGWLYNLICK
jgi:hypothetical protein